MRIGNTEVRPLGCLSLFLVSVLASIVLTYLINSLL
jgi:hypothetical protein